MNKNGRGGKFAPNGYKILSIVLAAIIAAAALAELILWRLDYIVFQNPNAQEQTAEQDSLLIGESVGNGAEIKSAKITPENYAEHGISALAESAYTLTATVSPSNATNKEVDWSVEFVDPSSEWATGKAVTDYVTVTPASDGALTATVENLQDFGEQIIVRVSSREDSDISATCTVDYRKKIESVEIQLMNSNSTQVYYTIPDGADSFYFEKPETTVSGDMPIKPVITYSDYTIDDEFTNAYTVTYNQDFVAAMKSAGLGLIDDTDGAIAIEKAPGIYSFGAALVSDPTDKMMIGFGTGEARNKYVTAARKYAGEENTMGTLTFKFTGEHTSYTRTVKVSTDIAFYNFVTDSIDLSQGNIVF